MNTRKSRLILAAVLAGTTTVYADSVKFSSAPAAVQRAVQRRAGQQVQSVEFVDRETTNGQTTYEATWKDTQGVQQDFLVSENGKVLRDVTGAKPRNNITAPPAASANVSGFTGGQKAPLNWASETVQNRLKQMANGAEIRNFEKGQFNGQTAYEGSFKTNNSLVTVVLAEDGALLAQSPSIIATGHITTAPGATVAGFSNSQAAPLNWASETVQNKFKQMAKGAPIQNFQKGEFKGQPAYLGSYTQNGHTMTVVMGENGNVLSSTPSSVGSAPGSVTGIGR